MTEATNKATEEQKTGSIGEKPVGVAGIVSTMAYLILFSGFLLYSILIFWPIPPLKDGTNGDPTITFLFFKSFSISNEIRIVLIITLSGALGSMVHALRSFYKYVGNRMLVWSWLAMYIMLPFVGSTLGLLFYLIIRGGFFPQTTANETSPYGFMAMAALAGLFSEQAILKLKEVSQTLLAPPEKGKNSIPEKQEDIKEKAQ